MLCAALLSGCVHTTADLVDSTVAAATKECVGAGSAACYFKNSPVQLQDKPVTLPGRPYTFYPTARGLAFVDGAGRDWSAPRDTLTDGASIPPVFVAIVGSPRTPEFANAAAVHDAYCGVGNEGGTVYHAAPWQAVHRMFYDTLIVGGTDPTKAKVMFAAVWLGGPRWNPLDGTENTINSRVPNNIQADIMIETKSFIEREKPDMDRLLSYLNWQEKKMMWRTNGFKAKARAANPVTSPNGN